MPSPAESVCNRKKLVYIAKLANYPQSDYTKKLVSEQCGAGPLRQNSVRDSALFGACNPQEEFMLVIHARRHIGAQEAMPS